MTNLYKVWSGDAGYLLQHADTPLKAKQGYATDIGMEAADVFEEGADIHYSLVYENIDDAYPDNEDEEIRCVKMLDMDLMLAGITHPQWAEKKMFYGWWWHEKDEDEGN